MLEMLYIHQDVKSDTNNHDIKSLIVHENQNR